MSSAQRFLGILSLLTMLLCVATASAQSGVTVFIVSEPPGAKIVVNGVSQGTAPQNVYLPLGFHDISFSWDGSTQHALTHIISHEQTIVVGRRDQVVANGDLYRVHSAFQFFMWANDFNAFSTGYIETPININLDKKTVYSGNAFGYIQDENLTQMLNTDRPIMGILSGRYVLYWSTKLNDYVYWDIQTGDGIRIGIPWDVKQVTWSSDQDRATLSGRSHGTGAFLFYDDGSLTVYDLSGAAIEVDDQPNVVISQIDRFLSYPSQNRQGLIYGLISGNPPSIWLVDLPAGTAHRVPVNHALDAGFSPDGQYIYVVHKAGITRFNHDLTDAELVSTVPNALGVWQASLSPSTEYVFMYGNNTEAPEAWIYRIPKISLSH